MDDGYARFRRLNDELNREGRRRDEREHDRRDAERRHQEMIAAAKHRGSRVHESNPPASSVNDISLKRAVILVLTSLFLLAVWSLFVVSNSSSSGVDARRSQFEGRKSVGQKVTVDVQATQMSSAENPNGVESRTPQLVENAATASTGSLDMEKLRGPVLRALDSGEAVGWEAEGRSGFVRTSAPTEMGERTCRTVAVSVIGQDMGGTSTVWCRSAGSDWLPVDQPGSRQ